MIASLFPRTFCGTNVHLGVTGSIAAYKALDLMRLLMACGCRAGVTLTDSARRFVTPESFRALGAHVVYEGMFAPGQGTPFPHLKPGQDDHCLLIAPATANILAKLAHGLADDLLSCQALAFKGPVVVAPAMNPTMWAAAATRRNWQIIRELGYQGIEPDAGDVACGDTGRGRLPAIEVLAAQVLRRLSPQDLAGKKVLVSLGPTREYWDRVRFLSNPSSGKMGAAIALAAWLRGAEVTAVCGPVAEPLSQGLPKFFSVRRVTTASEMHAACLELMPEMDVICMTAAVADFAPIPVTTGKYKKSAMGGEGISLNCQPVADILADMGKRKGPQQTLIGFAAEAGDPDAEAGRKLEAKNLDMILANRIDTEGSGFESDTNEVTLLARNGRRETWPRLPKPEVAWRLWDFLPCL